MTRREEQLFDPRLADWLEDDPHTAPDQALDVVLAAFPSIKQRRASRVPWRYRNMSTSVRLGLTAAAVVVAAVGGLWALGPRLGPAVGGPALASPSPAVPSPVATTMPSPPPSEGAGPATTTFTSAVYGYTVDHPVAFTAAPATESWKAGDLVGNDEPWVDRFFGQTGAFVGIASQALPAGTTAGEWMADYAEALLSRGCTGPVSAWTDTTVNGAGGRRLEFECGGFDGLEIVWVNGDLGWAITGDPVIVELMLETLEVE
jgi:hypothetical protein